MFVYLLVLTMSIIPPGSTNMQYNSIAAGQYDTLTGCMEAGRNALDQKIIGDHALDYSCVPLSEVEP